MKRQTMYRVYKFFPPRCPKCQHDFRSYEDFGLWGGHGNSFIQAMQDQMEAFPELFPKRSKHSTLGYSFAKNKGNGNSFYNRFETDFIFCRHCENVSLRIPYASRQVRTKEEAELLVQQQGYTGWTEVQAWGNMAKPIQTLAWLGKADLDQLQSAVLQARKAAEQANDLDASTAIYEETIEPVLQAYVKKLQEYQLSAIVEQRLQDKFGESWDRVHPDCRDFLCTAEILKDELCSYAETNPAIDFTAAVQMYSKALEKELLETLFIAFRNSTFAAQLPTLTGKYSIDRSIKTLTSFVSGGRHLTLGDMAFGLRNLACEIRHAPGNGFVRFIQARIRDSGSFCDDVEFPDHVKKYADDFRNKAAHVSRFSFEECMAARAYLIEEPVKLLIQLQEFLK